MSRLSKLEEQKKLMGILESDLFQEPQVPVTVMQKINDMKIHADSVFHHSEIAARNFKKITNKLRELELKAAENADVLTAEAKTLMSFIRASMEEIDNAQSRANDLLKSLDFIVTGDYFGSVRGL